MTTPAKSPNPAADAFSPPAEGKAVSAPWASFYGLSVALDGSMWQGLKPLSEPTGVLVARVFNDRAGADVPVEAASTDGQP